MSVVIHSKLDVDDYMQLLKVCEEADITRYAFIQDAVREKLLKKGLGEEAMTRKVAEPNQKSDSTPQNSNPSGSSSEPTKTSKKRGKPSKRGEATANQTTTESGRNTRKPLVLYLPRNE